MTKLAIFDLDGTLVDSLQDIAAAMNHALSRHGLPTHEKDALRKAIGEGARKLVERLVPEDRKSLLDSVEKTYLQYAAEHFAVHSRLYPGIGELLDELVKRALPLAVLSNKSDAPTQGIVRLLLKRWSFAVVRGEQPPVPLKPHPEAALGIAKVLNVHPTDTLFIGDSGIDMKTAKAAQMVPIGALWGFRSRAELLENGARVLLEHPLQLLEWLD